MSGRGLGTSEGVEGAVRGGGGSEGVEGAVRGGGGGGGGGCSEGWRGQ